jgi:tRNA A-37 threonylcarbamoyl transferase component Bud32
MKMSEPLVEEVDALAAYDEQLRQGVEVVATGSTADLAAVLPLDLTDCLRLIEQVWPRNGRSSGGNHLPSPIGRFEVERVLGQGGFGIVYLAYDPFLRRKVALKVPRLHVLSNEALRDRFRREGRAMAALDHPHIVPIHELGESGPLCYIAFALCEGPSLAQWLKERTLPVRLLTAARIVQQLAQAMHYSHSRGVLHRDLKPNNVLMFPATLDSNNGIDAIPFVPRIVDFGLARMAEEELEATRSSALIGTPLYMAPEQAFGRPDEVGPAADVYALGIILYELLTGHPPFTGSTPLEVLDQVRSTDPPALRGRRRDVPRDLETVCLRCLQKRPAERYASAQELAEDLKRFITGGEVMARPVSMSQRLVRICEQPSRIREAGLTVIGVHTAIILSMTLAMYMVYVGDVVQRPSGFRLSTWAPLPTIFMLIGHAPLIYAGWMLLHRRVWAAWASLMVGAAMLIAILLFILGLFPEGVTHWDEIPGFRIFYPMMAVLLAGQIAMSAISLLALNRLSKP